MTQLMLTDESGNSLDAVLPGLQTLLSDARPPPARAASLGPFVRLVPPASDGFVVAAAALVEQTASAESESAFCSSGHPALTSSLPPITSTTPPPSKRRFRTTPPGRRPGGPRRPPAGQSQQQSVQHRRPSRDGQPTRAADANAWLPPALDDLQPRSPLLQPHTGGSRYSRSRRAPDKPAAASLEDSSRQSQSNWFRLEGFLPPLPGLSYDERYTIR